MQKLFFKKLDLGCELGVLYLQPLVLNLGKVTLCFHNVSGFFDFFNGFLSYRKAFLYFYKAFSGNYNLRISEDVIKRAAEGCNDSM